MPQKNFSAVPAECVETKFLPLLAECEEKIFFTAKISNITNIQGLNFNANFEFRGNIIEVSDRWRIGIRSCWHAGGEKLEPMYGNFFFVGNPVNMVKKIFSPLETAKILCIQH